MLGPHTMQNQQRSASGVKEEDQRVDSDVIKRPVESTTKDALSCEEQQQQKREESPASDKAPKTAKAPPPISSSSEAAKKKATEEIDIDDDVALTFPQRVSSCCFQTFVLLASERAGLSIIFFFRSLPSPPWWVSCLAARLQYYAAYCLRGAFSPNERT